MSTPATFHFRHFFCSVAHPLDTLPPMIKDVGIRIRVQRELREQYASACKEQDKPPAQVLHEFMRSYVQKHAQAGTATQSQKT